MQQTTLAGFDAPIDNKAKLEQKFIIPPFSIMDTRQGYWQDRKRMWLALGIKSEIGRGELKTNPGTENTGCGAFGKNYRKQADRHSNVTSAPKKPEWATGTGTENMAPGTSIFDPVLCELIYKWFCPEQGAILDPFAGGSVRGIVASLLGYNYYGIDLTAPQIEANIEQGKELVSGKQPHWYVGDSSKLDTILPLALRFDLVFTCPPYHDLEKYSDDMDDLSNMSWETFKSQYSQIINKAILRLKPNRFACFVVSEIRDDKGFYKGLVPFIIDAFKRGGMWYYNEIILVNSVGSLPVRIEGQFRYRKIGRTHQNILIFYKGDTDTIPQHFKDVDTTMIEYQ